MCLYFSEHWSCIDVCLFQWTLWLIAIANALARTTRLRLGNFCLQSNRQIYHEGLPVVNYITLTLLAWCWHWYPVAGSSRYLIFGSLFTFKQKFISIFNLDGTNRYLHTPGATRCTRKRNLPSRLPVCHHEWGASATRWFGVSSIIAGYRRLFEVTPFLAEWSTLWLNQVEALFFLRNITFQQTMFLQIVSSLSSEQGAEIRDVLMSPPADRPHNYLKDMLIQWTTASEIRRIQQLLTAEELGDRTPSQTLRQMKQLLGETLNADDSLILRQPFLQQLPHPVRMILGTTPGFPLET